MLQPKTKNILGLVASPRQFGNCELFTKEISRHIEGEYTLKLIRLDLPQHQALQRMLRLYCRQTMSQ